MTEVWLLETHYDDQEYGQYEEIFLHIPDTDIWITNEGILDPYLETVHFTKLFWSKMNDEHLFTKLGEF